MTECCGRYVVMVGNVIHGLFPHPEKPSMSLKPDPVPYEVSPPYQLELELSGGNSHKSTPLQESDLRAP